MPERDQAPRPLTLAFVRHVTVPGRYHDENGLFLTVTGTGGKNWTQRLTIQGRRRDIGLGSAHTVTPAQARRLAAKNKAIARAGKNPFVREEPRAAREEPSLREVTFAAFNVNRFRRLRAAPGSREHVSDTYKRVRLHANPHFGRRPIAEITGDEIADALAKIVEERRTIGFWLREALRRIFDEAVAEGLRKDNPVLTPRVDEMPELQSTRAQRAARLKAAAPLEGLPAFLREIEADGRRKTAFLLARFCLLTVRHPSECRLATWAQIDLAKRTWTFPRMQDPSKRAIELDLHEGHLEILAQARPTAVGGLQGHLFASKQALDQPLRSESLSGALKEAGYVVTVSDFARAHEAWVDQEGGDPADLRAWWDRLRQDAPT